MPCAASTPVVDKRKLRKTSFSQIQIEFTRCKGTMSGMCDQLDAKGRVTIRPPKTPLPAADDAARVQGVGTDPTAAETATQTSLSSEGNVSSVPGS